MIDLKLLRTSPAQVRAALARRGDPGVGKLLDELEALDMRRRAVTAQLDQLKSERNDAARADARVVKEKGGIPPDVLAQRKQLGARISALESEQRDLEATVEAKGLFVPNLPLPELPDGGASCNTVVRTWGAPAPAGGRPHWEIGERLGILDLARGAKLSGSGFPVFVGAGAKLVRALINLMLDLHGREHGYVEVEPPLAVRREIMQGTGQLPKFEADMYRTTPDELYLVPTAEVPVTNLHRNEIVDGAALPLAYVAYTPCFRRTRRRCSSDWSCRTALCCSPRATWGSRARRPTILRCGLPGWGNGSRSRARAPSPTSRRGAPTSVTARVPATSRSWCTRSMRPAWRSRAPSPRCSRLVSSPMAR